MGTRSGGFEVWQARASADTVRAVREGRWVAILGDQNAGRYGVFVPFFGLDACTYPLASSLVAATVRPLLLGGAAPRAGVQYDFHVRRYVHKPGLDVDAAQRDILLATTPPRGVDPARAEQYLWLHRRWKTGLRRVPARTCRSTITAARASAPVGRRRRRGRRHGPFAAGGSPVR